jgi:capsular exopolysaccharide synthesis family protein
MGYYFDAIQRAAGVVPAQVVDLPAERTTTEQTIVKATPALPATTLKEVAGKNPRQKRKFSFNSSDKDVVVTARGNLELSDVLAVEQFRNLRVRLLEIARTRTLRTIVVTSANPKEGKTAISANLAFASSQVKDKRTLLVDADLRNPSIGKLLGMPSGPGLTDYLYGRAAFEDILCEIGPNFDVITSSETSEASELLQGNKLAEFIRKCSDNYNYVIIDSPPLGLVSDAQTLSASADGALFVVRTGSKRELVVKATEGIKSKILGVVLNFGRASTKNAYHYGIYRAEEGSARGKQK